MTEFQKIITHSRRLKSALKGLSMEDLEENKAKLSGIIEGRKEEQKELEKEEAEHLEKIAKYRKMMEADGIDLADLQGQTREIKGRGGRPPKYAINEKGKRTTWTGQGRMPNVFRKQIDKGAKIEDFLIN